jgi:PAS domain S-box-containing protein
MSLEKTNAKMDVIGDRHSFVLIGLAAVWLACLIFAVMRLTVTWRTGLLTPWWGNLAGLVGITALYVWYRRAPQARSSGTARGTAVVATLALLLPIAYGMPSTIWWLSLVGFAMVLLGRWQEAKVWWVTIPLLVLAALIATPYVQVKGAAGEPFLEAALAKSVFVVILLSMAAGFRRVAEKRASALHDSEERYRTLFQRVPVGVFHCDCDLRITDCNQQFERILGGGHDSLIGADLSSLSDQRLLPAVRGSLSGEACTYDGPYRAPAAAGEVSLSCRTVPLYDRDAAIVGTLGLVEDVSDRKRMEAELRTLNEAFEARALTGEGLAARRLRQLEHLNSVLHAIRKVNKLIVQEKDPAQLIQKASDMLVETRGYHGAWIATQDIHGKPTRWAEASWGEAFIPIGQAMKERRWPTCRKKALNSDAGLAVLDPKKDCGTCPLCKYYGQDLAVVIPLRHGDRTFGMLGVSLPNKLVLAEEEKSLLIEVAGDIALALWSIETKLGLAKRLQELACLYAVSHDIQHNLPFAELCSRAVEHIVPAMQFPEIAAASIELADGQFTSENWVESLSHGLVAEIGNEGESFGYLRVCYSEERPFLVPEEQNLLDGIAEALGLALNQIRNNEARLQAEQMARTLALAVEESGDAIGMSTPEGKHYYQNKAFTALFGKPGESPQDSLYVDAQVEREVFETLTDGRSWTGDVDLRGLAGDVLTVSLRGYPIVDQDRKVVGLVGVHTDITQRKRLQGQIAQSDRLASMGMLAAGVAHEIKNPLAYVLYNLESLNDDLPRLYSSMRRCFDIGVERVGYDEWIRLLGSDQEMVKTPVLNDVQERFRDALKGAHRIKDIARGLGTFSRVEKDSLVPVNLMQVIEIAVNMVFHEIKYRCRLVKEYQKTSSIMANDGRLSQVFLNLLVNATHSIEEGDVDSNEIRVRTWEEGGEVFAEVRDTGKGIGERDIARIFQPFFTTKEVGVGTGLGLAISKTIVEGYGGTIDVTSEIGRGTSFVVRLPIEQDEEAVEAVPHQETAPEPSIHGRILVIDDEQGIRSAMTRMLKNHDVVEACSGEEAREILETDQAFDLILCDMMMPGVSGLELHEWLVSTHPTVAKRVVFVTGGAFSPKAREYLKKVNNLRIDKPFDVTNFMKIVNDRICLVRATAKS